MFSALLAGANGMPTARFLLFNVAGGICFGAIALGAEIYKISETLSVISLGLLLRRDMHSQFSFDAMNPHCTVGR
jgi:membrane protein DedA with SNARE-associated domain